MTEILISKGRARGHTRHGSKLINNPQLRQSLETAPKTTEKHRTCLSASESNTLSLTIDIAPRTLELTGIFPFTSYRTMIAMARFS